MKDIKNGTAHFTAGEFAELHHINKRTLHYYDEIGLFSPQCKGENGYRYYTYEQSMELENILAFRELDMSIEEIMRYMENPNAADFYQIADSRIKKIEYDIQRLKNLKSVLQQKKELLAMCDKAYDGKIEVVSLNMQYLLLTPLALSFETKESWMDNTASIMDHLKRSWDFNIYKKSCGSYLSVEKIIEGKFHEYDGIFTEIERKGKGLYRKPEGRYLRGFCVGDWDKIPKLYEEMIGYAKKNSLCLCGYAFESGVNEFAISDEQEYITLIEVQIL